MEFNSGFKGLTWK